MIDVNVVSVFDGMRCGLIAMKRIGVNVKTYQFSEIDKSAIFIGDKNNPGCIPLGSVVDVDPEKLGFFHAFIGGSPCQSFSFAGKRKGMSTKDDIEILTLEHYLRLKGEGFEFEGQSYLFWEYMRILTALRKVNPNIYFLLENVEMGAKWQKILTKAIGINPIKINSSKVSAQNRKRIYWTNIGAEQDGLFGDLVCKIQQPKDKGIFLKDILETEVDQKYFLSEKAIQGILKHKEEQKEKGFGFGAVIKNGTEKMNALKIGGSGIDDLVVHNMMPRSGDSKKGGTGHLTRADGKTYCLDTGNTNAIEFKKDVPFYTANNLQYKTDGYSQDHRAYYEEGHSQTLTTKEGQAKVLLNNSRIRRLTPLECERLQTVPDGYTEGVSDTQRYKMLGNGWTVDIIAHIFSYLPKEFFKQ